MNGVNRSILLGRAAFPKLVMDLADAPPGTRRKNFCVLSLSAGISARRFPYVNVALIVASFTIRLLHEHSSRQSAGAALRASA